MLLPIVLGKVASRLLIGQSTRAAIKAVTNVVEASGFKRINTIEDPSSPLVIHAWYDYQPPAHIARHFPEMTVHADLLSGVTLEARPLVLGSRGVMTIEQRVLLNQVTDNMVAALKINSTP